jgi:ADP-heptose:LPS heptosyltransferase
MMVAPTRPTILVMRFSALGDVALTVPVIKAFLTANKEVSVIMASEKHCADLFSGIERLEFEGFDLKGEFKGFLGIFRIFNLLRKKYSFSMVADLHGVIRTHVLRFLFEASRRKTEVINKGRIEKYALVRKENKIFRPLPHATERYADVFRRLGFKINLPHLGDVQVEEAAKCLQKGFEQHTAKSPTAAGGLAVKIGFAPFAKHAAKMYSLDKFKEIVQYFDRAPYELYFFGGKGAERLILADWEENFTRAVSMAKTGSMAEELKIMKDLRVMVTMDSANMHLASLVGVPVVSIWGATHPYSGFYGFQQDPLNAVQVNLSCRPCSVFGNTTCWRGDHACMEQISPSMVEKKLLELLKG